MATMLSSVTGLPAYFVRKEPKKYGTEQVCEGGEVGGRRLLIVEDVVTTGGQIVLSAQDLRSEGAVVENAVCVIDRDGGGVGVAAAEGITLRALFSMRDLEASGPESAMWATYAPHEQSARRARGPRPPVSPRDGALRRPAA